MSFTGWYNNGHGNVSNYESPNDHGNVVTAESTPGNNYNTGVGNYKFYNDVMMTQLQQRRYFVYQFPTKSKQEAEICPQVRNHSKTVHVHVLQQTSVQPPRCDPVTIYASDEVLLEPLKKIIAHGPKAHHPTDICLALIQGVQLLKKKMEGRRVYTYPNIETDPIPNSRRETTSTPTASSGTSDDRGDVVPLPRDMPLRGLGCAACNASLRSQSPKRTRVAGQCRFLCVEPRNLYLTDVLRAQNQKTDFSIRVRTQKVIHTPKANVDTHQWPHSTVSQEHDNIHEIPGTQHEIIQVVK